jgi:hypothetical protein
MVLGLICQLVVSGTPLVIVVLNFCKNPLYNSVEQSPSWEANSHSASQEIHSLLWDTNINLPHLKQAATNPCSRR